ncbi:MAG: sulfotransferase family 2 domain-containing protein [Verrucomicrobia bacterium]|nr:sulfotransferase family 2 domain-containing protein [Verrucomicrobiota bacterium]
MHRPIHLFPCHLQNLSHMRPYLILSCLLVSLLTAEDKLLFLHIPKTGGVTVSSLLLDHYHSDELKNIYPPGSHPSLFELEMRHNLSDYKLITFLRNPAERVLSEERYCIGKFQGNSEILHAHRLDPHGRPVETASNITCYLLSGLNSSAPISAHLAHAKEALSNRFFFVGITEKMEESIDLLYRSLAWTPPSKIPHFNHTRSYQNAPSEELVEAIRERNWADIALYEYALALYEERRAHIPLPQVQVQRFEDHIHYTFDQQLQGFGWCPREWAEKRAYRWAAEENRAVLFLPLPPGLDYRIHTTLFLQPIFLSHLSMKVNETPISFEPEDDLDLLNTEFSWIRCCAYIPKSCIEGGKVTSIELSMKPPLDPILQEIYEKDHSFQSIYFNYTKGKFACIEMKSCPENLGS